MDSPQDLAFRAILNFANELHTIFGPTGQSMTKSQIPFAAYHRLLGFLRFTDIDSINRVIGGFTKFLILYDEDIVSGRMALPTTARVEYTDKAYIDIGRMYSTADDDTKTAIRKHLLNISAIIFKSEEKKKLLMTMLAPTPASGGGGGDAPTIDSILKSVPGLSDGSKESNILKDVMSKVSDAASTTDASNPAEAIKSILSSDAITNLLGGMTDGSNDLDFGKLSGTIQSLMGAFMGGSGGGLASMFTGMSALTGGGTKAKDSIEKDLEIMKASKKSKRAPRPKTTGSAAKDVDASTPPSTTSSSTSASTKCDGDGCEVPVRKVKKATERHSKT